MYLRWFARIHICNNFLELNMSRVKSLLTKKRQGHKFFWYEATILVLLVFYGRDVIFFMC